MIRFLTGVGLWGLTWAVGTTLSTSEGPVWVHPVRVVQVRAFGVRVRPVTAEPGHVFDANDPTKDTGR